MFSLFKMCELSASFTVLYLSWPIFKYLYLLPTEVESSASWVAKGGDQQ